MRGYSFRGGLALIALLLSACRPSSEPEYTFLEFEGTVRDAQSGEPVVGATVRVYEADGAKNPFGLGSLQSTVSDATGRYVLTHPTCANIPYLAARLGDRSSGVKVGCKGSRQYVDIALSVAP